MKKLIVDKQDSNQRLDKFLLKFLNAATKSFVYKMLRKKNIKLNGLKCAGNEILKPGDEIFLYLSDQTINKFCLEKKLIKSSRPVNILYENEDILICDKPCGILSQPDSNKKNSDSLLNRLYNLYGKKIFICNRLDRNTSGIIICAKNFLAAQYINKIIFDRKVDKFYLALVSGKIDKPGRLEDFIIKDKSKNQVVINKIQENDLYKKIITEYTPIKWNDKFSLIKIKLITGRSHQIRAHLKNINHPLVGDMKYGDININLFFKHKFNLCHQLLHAHEINFIYHDVNLSIRSDLPNYFLDILRFIFRCALF